MNYVVFLDIPNTPRRWYTGFSVNVNKWSFEYPDAAYLTKREAKKIVKAVKDRCYLVEIARGVVCVPHGLIKLATTDEIMSGGV